MYTFNDSNTQEKKKSIALKHFMQVKNYSLHISFVCTYFVATTHTSTGQPAGFAQEIPLQNLQCGGNKGNYNIKCAKSLVK